MNYFGELWKIFFLRSWVNKASAGVTLTKSFRPVRSPLRCFKWLAEVFKFTMPGN